MGTVPLALRPAATYGVVRHVAVRTTRRNQAAIDFCGRTPHGVRTRLNSAPKPMSLVSEAATVHPSVLRPSEATDEAVRDDGTVQQRRRLQRAALWPVGYNFSPPAILRAGYKMIRPVASAICLISNHSLKKPRSGAAAAGSRHRRSLPVARCRHRF